MSLILNHHTFGKFLNIPNGFNLILNICPFDMLTNVFKMMN